MRRFRVPLNHDLADRRLIQRILVAVLVRGQRLFKQPLDKFAALARRAVAIAPSYAFGHFARRQCVEQRLIGDGVMALFGVAGDGGTACREALQAAQLMSLRLAELNESLRGELIKPLRIAIGVHAGPAIVGEMGYGSTRTMTAIGDAVNVASRLETLAKEFDVELVVSEEVVTRAGIDLNLFHWKGATIRGRQETIAVAVIESAGNLPEIDRIVPASVTTVARA